MPALLSSLHLRRQDAIERYLAGNPIEAICREMGCAKSWLYKWKKRHQCTEPDGVQEYSRRPESTPTQTPETLEAAIIRLRQTLSADGLGTVSADVMRDSLCQHGSESRPSRRTIYRIFNRQTEEVKADSFSS